MVILERMVQHIYPEKWPDLNAIVLGYPEAGNGEFNQVEGRLGFPAKKRFQLITGADEFKTLIVERQWPSMAVMETTFEKAMADPEYQALGMKANAIIKDVRYELYWVLP